MFKCDICGRQIKKKIRLKGYTLCSKHMHQLLNHGKFLDNLPRSQNDLNEYKINGDVAVFNLYDGKNSHKISEFIIDTKNLSKVKYHKWRLNHSHVVTGLPSQHTQRELSWVIMGIDNRDEKNKGVVIDHINNNPLDNRECNLRVCTQSENTINRSKIVVSSAIFMGVYKIKNQNKYDPEIRRNGIRCHLGKTSSLEEAVYKRLIAEQLVFKEYANIKELEKKKMFTENLSDARKKELENITKEKLKNKGLWQ